MVFAIYNCENHFSMGGCLVQSIAIIGLAKNAGKTVSFNKLSAAAVTANLKLALVSYGRDGEKIDAVTLKEKPPILVPEGAFFATTFPLVKESGLQSKVIAETGIKTLLGEVKVFQSLESGEIELAGVNSVTKVKKIKQLLPSEVDLLLLDGALDRRSSARPELAAGFILATGAVTGQNCKEVIKKTSNYLQKLSLARQNSNGKLEKISIEGALTDLLAKEILSQIKTPKHSLAREIVIQDGTKNFLSRQMSTQLQKAGFKITVKKPVQLLAITVNPFRPDGRVYDDDLIIQGLKKHFPETRIFNPLKNNCMKEVIKCLKNLK